MTVSLQDIRLKHGQHLRFVFGMAWNAIMRLRLRLYKWLHGIRRPIVHYYTLCWNEERILPFVLDYYSRFADRLTVFDNHSTDGSAALARQYPNVTVEQFGHPDVFDDAANMHLKNQCWKRSRGKADWVVVCDMDELLYHADLGAFLADARRRGITLPDIEGYDMYSAEYPPYERGRLLTDMVRRGVPTPWEHKHLLFDPHALVDINYDPGAHHCRPVGIVRGGGQGLKVLHYKGLGRAEVLARYRLLGARLSAQNRAKGYGTHYLGTDEAILAKFDNDMAQCTDVI